MSAEGKLYTCLFATEGLDVRSLLRGGASDAELQEQVRARWHARMDRYSAERTSAGRTRPIISKPAKRIEMSYIGG